MRLTEEMSRYYEIPNCTCCTVKRSLVSDDQLIGKVSYVALIDDTTQTHPLAVIDV